MNNGVIVRNKRNSVTNDFLVSGTMSENEISTGVAYVDDAAVYEKQASSSGYRLAHVNFSDGITRLDGGNEFYIKDHLGSTRAIMNDNGVSGDWLLKEAMAYLAYGAIKQLNNPLETGRKKFTGKEFDEEGGSSGKVGVDLTFAFDPNQLDLDPAKRSVVALYYTDYGVTPAVGATFECAIDEDNNRAVVKGLTECSEDKQVKWMHILLNYEKDSDGDESWGVNTIVDNIDQDVGPGTMALFREADGDPIGFSQLPALVEYSGSFLRVYMDDAFEVAGLRLNYFGARYYVATG